MLKYDFNKVTKQLNWNCISTWVFSCKFAAYFQYNFSKEQLWRTSSSSKPSLQAGWHCVKPYSLQMRENTDQKNSEYGHLLCNVTFSDILLQKAALTGDVMVVCQVEMRREEWVQGSDL